MALEYGFDLFAELGIAPEEPKKDEKKKKSSGTSKKQKAKKQEEKVTLPVTVYTGYREPVSLTEKEFLGKTEITLKEAHEYLASVYTEYPVGISVLQKGKSNVLYLIHEDLFVKKKGSFALKKDTKLMLADLGVELSLLKTSEECEVTSEDLQKCFAIQFAEYGEVGFLHSAISDILVPSFDFPKLEKEVDFPVNVKVFGRPNLIIEKDTYLEFITKESDTKNSKEDEEDATKDKPEVSKAEKEVLEDIIISNYPDFAEGHLELQWNDKEKSVIVKMIGKSFSPPAPKKEEYPTNATLSLLYTTIQLTPEMFGGKEKVESEELRKYIEKDRPEYSKERTNTGYDEKNNLIIMTVSGSKKGIELVTNNQLAEEKLLSDSSYELFDWYTNTGKIFRAEKTDKFFVVAPKINRYRGIFKLSLHKVPYKMHIVALKFFSYIYDRFKTEAMLQLFWDEEKKEYFWFFPLQTASLYTCEIVRDIEMEKKYSLIADIHSHGFHDINFSNTDNEDEKGFRIYGVYGHFGRDDFSPKLSLRAGTGGCFVDIEFDDLFTDCCEDEEEYIEDSFQKLLNFISLKFKVFY